MKQNTLHYSIEKGYPFPLGASSMNNGVNFALFSRHGSSIDLLLFHENEEQPFFQVNLDHKLHRTGDLFHILIKGLKAPFFYAYKIDGVHEKSKPFRYDKSLLLLDPYAKALYRPNEQEDIYLAAFLPPKPFESENCLKPNIPMKDLIIYEMHVRGFTIDPTSQTKNPGTFLGIIEKIPHLLDLGINAVEFMPIHEFDKWEYEGYNPFNNERLCNYWGYSPLNYFSLNRLYATNLDPDAPLHEFKTVVKELHRHGIEVIIDVVFNHTGEGNQLGPTISFKGIDNSVYYLLDAHGDYYNFSGCGNTLNCNHPVVAELILQSLKYFVTETEVDGFRFDLASVFYRGEHGELLGKSSLVDYISKDPVLSQTKLIAEPWDALGFYQVGSFYKEKIRWSEWNARYRDRVRYFLNGIKREPGKFATRICGSEDLYYNRAPYTSINFITSHDGFSLRDLVSYNIKHNFMNGENNEDGLNLNISYNFGAEGKTTDPYILSLRERQMRNFHLALMISQGVPMIYMGDEYGATKNGNNNSWCQDNPINWFSWELLHKNHDFYRFYKLMIHFRKSYSCFRRDTFLTTDDISWHGRKPFLPNFEEGESFIAFTIKSKEENKQFYIAFNTSEEEEMITIPTLKEGENWEMIADTAEDPPKDFYIEENRPKITSKEILMKPYSSIILESLI